MLATYRVITCEAVVYLTPGGSEVGRLTIDAEIHGRPAATSGWISWLKGDGDTQGYIRAVDLLEVRVREVGR